MSTQRKWPWLIGAFALCFFAGGPIVWTGSYVDYLEMGFPWGILLLMAVASLFLSWVVGVGIVAGALAVASALPTIVFTRVVLDGVQDPSSHNLWPFEIVMAVGLALITTFPFAAVGTLLRRITYRSQA
jgi:hypothetical protein